MIALSKRWRAIGAVAAVELLVLGGMVWDRVGLLQNGREIELDVVPVDPRSLFRGDYVILSYDVSRFDGGKLDGDLAKGRPIYVTIAQDAGGKWQVQRASVSAKVAASGAEVVLKGRTDRWRFPAARATSPVNVRYGIESYFVPEGTGKALEKMVGEKRIKAVVAVGRDGTAALKGLKVDGQLVHKEPVI
ncbi:MAG: GDYXXLXY domain-containing protein [Hyphomicrobium sp.]